MAVLDGRDAIRVDSRPCLLGREHQDQDGRPHVGERMARVGISARHDPFPSLQHPRGMRILNPCHARRWFTHPSISAHGNHTHHRRSSRRRRTGLGPDVSTPSSDTVTSHARAMSLRRMGDTESTLTTKDAEPPSGYRTGHVNGASSVTLHPTSVNTASICGPSGHSMIFTP